MKRKIRFIRQLFNWQSWQSQWRPNHWSLIWCLTLCWSVGQRPSSTPNLFYEFYESKYESQALYALSLLNAFNALIASVQCSVFDVCSLTPQLGSKWPFILPPTIAQNWFGSVFAWFAWYACFGCVTNMSTSVHDCSQSNVSAMFWRYKHWQRIAVTRHLFISDGKYSNASDRTYVPLLSGQWYPFVTAFVVRINFVVTLLPLKYLCKCIRCTALAIHLIQATICTVAQWQCNATTMPSSLLPDNSIKSHNRIQNKHCFKILKI